ncbi:MAG: cysteine desulfurase [Candidatus Diapherotrites archaeon]|nr:cysteine desulfurase [Candidatus Diapherotrites archaeon]
MALNVEKLRNDFPCLQKKFDGKPLVYLDNAATSLKPNSVIDKEAEYYKEYCANIHRGMHKMSEQASREFELAHEKTAKFIGAKSEKEIIFMRNATEGFNLLMYSLCAGDFFKPGDEILVSRMEHHANLVPWQFLQQMKGTKLNFVELNEDFTLNMDDLKGKLSSKTKLVSLTQASNTVSSIVDVKKACEIVKKNSQAYFAVDAAQSVPHLPVNVRDIGCDFLMFSSHKMLGPTGIGVLYGKEEILEKMQPFMYGGDMIKEVKWNSSSWNELPSKFEAGTPAIAQGIAFGAAIDYLQKVGMQNIRQHEKEITKYALERMKEIPQAKVYGPRDLEKRNGIVLFEAGKLDCHDIALALDEHSNVAVRSGMHCAQPIVESLNPKGLARASFYFYNTKQEIDVFIESLKEIVGTFK